MAGSTADLKTGAVINFNGTLHVVMEYEHRAPGKGGAFYQVKMRNMDSGRLCEHRYRSGESIEYIRLEKKEYQYLYREGNHLNFMSQETYEQIPVEEEKVEGIDFLKENELVSISFVDDGVISVEVPLHVNLRVVQTEPGFKGDTATNVFKPATMDSGATIQVPLFINENDLLRVNTRTGEYIERVKE